MKKVLVQNTDNQILRRLFRKGEISYTVSDLSKAVGPMIDLMFVAQFIGPNGVTVMGYVAPLIMLFELIGTTIASGARSKVSRLVGAGDLDEANRAFSSSLVMGAGLSAATALLVFFLQIGIAGAWGKRFGDP